MTDNNRAYRTSLSRQFNMVVSRRDRELHNPVIATLLDRLPAALAAREPMEAVCCTGLTATMDYAARAVVVSARLLAQTGWDMHMSLLMYRNFVFLQPQPRYPVETLRLMTRTQLREEFGETYGDVIADVCTNPSLQPIFAALFFGDLNREVVRPMRHIVARFLVHEEIMLHRDTTLARGAELAIETVTDYGAAGAVPGTAPRILPYSEAVDLYRESTGEEPRFTFSINPREIDYARQAAQEEIRQAHDRGRVQRERPEIRNRFV